MLSVLLRAGRKEWKVVIPVVTLASLILLWWTKERYYSRTTAELRLEQPVAAVYNGSKHSLDLNISSAHPYRSSIRPNSMAYLVMGKACPAKRWIRRGSWDTVSMIYLSWKAPVSAALCSVQLPSRTQTVYFPHSTWATGRNHLLKVMKQREVDQGWRFEFVVFFDEDVIVGNRSPKNYSKLIINREDDDSAVQKLNTLLRRDRPMWAAASQSDGPPIGTFKTQIEEELGYIKCAQHCEMDHQIAAFHRTAVDMILPYDGQKDSMNWWISAYITQIVTGALVPDYCSFYREIYVDAAVQEHASYPRTETDELFAWGMRSLGQRLAKENIPGYWAGMDSSDVTYKVKPLLKRLDTPCISSPSTVDYEKVISRDTVEILKKLHPL